MFLSHRIWQLSSWDIGNNKIRNGNGIILKRVQIKRLWIKKLFITDSEHLLESFGSSENAYVDTFPIQTPHNAQICKQLICAYINYIALDRKV